MATSKYLSKELLHSVLSGHLLILTKLILTLQWQVAVFNGIKCEARTCRVKDQQLVSSKLPGSRYEVNNNKVFILT